MAFTLRACDRCHRHVRTSERQCPFCGTVTPSFGRRAAAGTLVAMLAASALAASGCDVASHASAQEDDWDEPVRQTPQYGAPSYDPGPPPPPPPSTPPPDNRDAGPRPPRAGS